MSVTREGISSQPQTWRQVVDLLPTAGGLLPAPGERAADHRLRDVVLRLDCADALCHHGSGAATRPPRPRPVPARPAREGSVIRLGVEPERLHLFDAATGLDIR